MASTKMLLMQMQNKGKNPWLKEENKNEFTYIE